MLAGPAVPAQTLRGSRRDVPGAEPDDFDFIAGSLSAIQALGCAARERECTMRVDVLLDSHAAIGESPTWVPAEQAIYWIDVKAPALHRLVLASGEARAWPLPSDVGAFALVAGQPAAIVALRTGIFRLGLKSGELSLLAPPPFDPSLFRFNEGACDSHGRFWVGVMFDPAAKSAAARPSSLHSFTLGGGLRVQPDAAELHNGMAWSRDETVFYLSHSHLCTVFAYPFDVTSGALGAPGIFVATPQDYGIPDGAAVDVEGCYWCALHGGSRLHRYRPDGRLDREVMLPVSQPTMCAFVGPELDLMVVTSASDQLDERQRAKQPHAGGMFCLRPGISGAPRPYQVV